MKKIMLILPSSNGTIARISYNLYVALSLKEVEVYVVILSKSANNEFSFDNEFIFESKTCNGLKKLIVLIQKILWLRKLKKKIKPDESISTMYNCSYINLLAGGNEYKIGIFHSPYYQTRDKGFLLYGLYYLSYIVFFSKLDKLFCVSQGITNAIKDNFTSITPQKVETVYNLHDIEGVRYKALEAMIEEENQLFEKNVILVVGRIEPNKSPERIIKAFLQLEISTRRNLNLIFIGENVKGHVEVLKEQFPEIADSENVIFLGKRENPYKYISRSFCVVSASFTEGLPGVLIEALLLNTPVVATNSSFGVWEILSSTNLYDKNLSGLVSTPDGIITSNLSYIEKDKECIDIENLKIALERMLHRKPDEIISFRFQLLLNSDYIVNKFLNY